MGKKEVSRGQNSEVSSVQTNIWPSCPCGILYLFPPRQDAITARYSVLS